VPILSGTRQLSWHSGVLPSNPLPKNAALGVAAGAGLALDL
jgi:hypothetical protein